jgi:hypothetical protein
MNELQPIIDLLVKQWPWVMKLAMGIGFARLAIKPIGLWLKSVLASAAAKAVASHDKIDDHWLELLFGSRPYVIFAFLLDLCASVKLPALEDLYKTPTP